MSCVRVTHWFSIFLDLWKINVGVIFVIWLGVIHKRPFMSMRIDCPIWLMNSDASPIISWASSERQFAALRTLGEAKSPPLGGSEASNGMLLINQHMAGRRGLSWLILSLPTWFFHLPRDLTDVIGKLPGYKQAEMLLQTSVIIRLLEKEPKFSDTCLCVHSFRNVRFRKAAEGADPLPPGQRLRPASVYLAGERSTAFFPFPQSFDQRSCELAFAVGQMGLCDADHAYSFGSKKKDGGTSESPFAAKCISRTRLQCHNQSTQCFCHSGSKHSLHAYYMSNTMKGLQNTQINVAEPFSDELAILNG